MNIPRDRRNMITRNGENVRDESKLISKTLLSFSETQQRVLSPLCIFPASIWCPFHSTNSGGGHHLFVFSLICPCAIICLSLFSAVANLLQFLLSPCFIPFQSTRDFRKVCRSVLISNTLNPDWRNVLSERSTRKSRV